MKYTKPGITLEKYTLAESIMADTSSVIEDGPPMEEEEPELNIQSTISTAFSDVLDFSNK